MQQLMDLLERFVVSQEQIAAAYANTKSYGGEKCERKEEPDPKKIEDTAEPNPQDEGYPNAADRDAWVTLCELRGIDVPPRTRTTTLVKLVKEHDSDTEKVEAPVIVDEDPFNTETEEPEVTRELVFSALQKVQKEQGNPKVFELLEKVGAKHFKDVPEEKYAALYKEIQND